VAIKEGGGRALSRSSSHGGRARCGARVQAIGKDVGGEGAPLVAGSGGRRGITTESSGRAATGRTLVGTVEPGTRWWHPMAVGGEVCGSVAVGPPPPLRRGGVLWRPTAYSTTWCSIVSDCGSVHRRLKAP
jgi:hypothetical protein